MANGRVLAAHGITKQFGSIRALGGASIEIRGEAITGLVGDNGAGKSTLVKVLSGVLRPDTGTVEVNGVVSSEFASPARAHREGIVTVYQDLGLVEPLTVADNVFLGYELKRGPFKRAKEMRRRTMILLSELGMGVKDPKVEIRKLSGGQRQAVAFARAYHIGGRFILLDEPTAATGVRETREVVTLIERLRERGAGVLLISHDIPLVVELCERIVVLRRGRDVGVLTQAEASVDSVVALMVGG